MQPGPLIVGVKVVNAGRAAFHVADWNFRAEPTGVSFNVLGEQMGSPTVPCDNIPAGAGRVFYIHYDAARTLKSGADCIEGKTHRIVATVSSGGRTFTLHTYLTTSEVAALAEECGGQGDVVLLVAYTGMRFGELVGLRVEDVDLKARRIRVRRSITQVGGKLVEGNPKSAAGRRSIPVPQRLIPILTDRVSGPSTRGARHHLAQRCAARTGELEALHAMARGHREDRPTEDARARPSAHLRFTRATGRRRSSPAAEDDGTRVDHGNGACLCIPPTTSWTT